MSLVGNIEKNAKKVRFHTPGHSGTAADFGKYDVTELSYSDNLLHPQGDIAALEQKIASAYRAEVCFISTQGATTSIWEAIFATKDDGDFLLIGPVHSSVYNAMRAFSLRAYHVGEFTDETVIPPSVKTAIMTSPDYFGNCLPLQKICERLHKKGIAVICDAAHGSHFAFSSRFPSPAHFFADLTVYSVHKTLPVATGGSVLLTTRRWAARCALARKTLHGTSPSYVTLCSIERAFENPERYPDLYEKVFFHVEQFAKKLKAPFSIRPVDDKTRLVLTSPFLAEEVASTLEKEGFVPEMSIENKVVFIVTPYNCDYLENLAVAINNLDLSAFGLYNAREAVFCKHKEPTPLLFGGAWEEVPLVEAIGRRLYVEVGLYPPGIPLAYSHDVLTEETAALLGDHPNNRFGLNGKNVYVLKE